MEKINLKDYINGELGEDFEIPDDEIWKHVETPLYPELQTYYAISNYGRVYSAKTGKYVKLRKKRKGNNYVSVRLSATDKDGKNTKKEVPIHRLMMAIFYPVENMENLQVNHIDGVKYHNTFDNLEWVTPSENIRHAYDNNLVTILEAENSPYTNYTNEMINNICKLFMTGKYSKKEIAEIVGVPIHIVRNVTVKDGNWKKITSKYDFSKRPMFRKSKKFTIQDIERMCQYFCDYPRDDEQSVRGYLIECANVLNIKPLDGCTLENLIYAMRSIYLRKNYTNISDKYEF